MEYLVSIAIFVGIYAILAIGLNLIVGYTGLLSFAQVGFFAAVVGDEMPSVTSGFNTNPGFATLWDSRQDGDHLEFDNDEGFIISNEIVQGTAGVLNMIVCVEWDEGVLSGGA